MSLSRVPRIVFGAHGQLVVGVLTFVGSITAWVYGAGLRGESLLRFLVHVSMAALVLASYGIVATALGFRATERVESAVTVEHADEVEVNQ